MTATTGRLIQNPILNSPFREPTRHFEFNADGITDRVVEGRRKSAYFIPVPQPRKKGAEQLSLLVVCGFAFDALAYEAAREFAPFPVMLARMNPDLAMGDELLKKTGAANLFMVFGEPDITLQKSRDGKLSVEIKGLDIYDPTTGEIRSHTTDDIACWFVDTDYNGDCFFVRQAYFTGATDPYEKLKRALKAEIDEATWESVRGTKSRPFDPPSTGMIAVKVINHYGDEVLKVYRTD